MILPSISPPAAGRPGAQSDLRSRLLRDHCATRATGHANQLRVIHSRAQHPVQPHRHAAGDGYFRHPEANRNNGLEASRHEQTGSTMLPRGLAYRTVQSRFLSPQLDGARPSINWSLHTLILPRLELSASITAALPHGLVHGQHVFDRHPSLDVVGGVENVSSSGAENLQALANFGTYLVRRSER